jgi:hypothetical protein
MSNSLADEIINNDIDAVVSILQRQRVDLNEFDEYGFTYLIEAAIANNYAIVKVLIDYGADVNLPDVTGGTSLMWAAENNNLRLAKLLLECRADPNAYNFAGQPVLTMPVVRNQQTMKQLLQSFGAQLTFAQDFINTKLLGHMFELVGTADLVDPKNNYVEIDFEGFYLEFSLGVIADSLGQFINHFGARKVRRFAELAKIAENVLDRASQIIKYQQYQTDINEYQTKIDALIQHEPLLIPVGYEGHAITFVKLGNIFAKIDRREDSRLYDNVVLYLVKQPQNLTLNFIKRMIYEKSSHEFINQELPVLLGLEPITELKVAAQISGNCSWANVEAVLPTIIFLLMLASPESEKNVPQFKSQALSYFNEWREWNKDRALQFCIQSFRGGDTIRNVCKAEILAAILFQRCRLDNVADRDRIESILAILRQPPYLHVLQNYIRSYCYESKDLEGQDFLRMLKNFGYV